MKKTLGIFLCVIILVMNMQGTNNFACTTNEEHDKCNKCGHTYSTKTNETKYEHTH